MLRESCNGCTVVSFCEYSDIWRCLVFIWNKQQNKTCMLYSCQSQAQQPANMLISQAVYTEIFCFHTVCWLELGPWGSQVINLQGFIFSALLMSSVSEQQPHGSLSREDLNASVKGSTQRFSTHLLFEPWRLEKWGIGESLSCAGAEPVLSEKQWYC